MVPLHMFPHPSYITKKIPFVIYGYPKQLQDRIDASFFFVPLRCLSKSMGTRDFKGNSFLRSAQWEAERDKKQPLDWYLWSAKCFLDTVQSTGKDMVHAPWGHHLNGTDEVRHNWLNSCPVLMTSLWEPTSSSMETAAIEQTLTSAVRPRRAWHSQPHQEAELCVWHDCLVASLPSQTQPSMAWQQCKVNRRLCG